MAFSAIVKPAAPEAKPKNKLQSKVKLEHEPMIFAVPKNPEKTMKSKIGFLIFIKMIYKTLFIQNPKLCSINYASLFVLTLF